MACKPSSTASFPSLAAGMKSVVAGATSNVDHVLRLRSHSSVVPERRNIFETSRTLLSSWGGGNPRRMTAAPEGRFWGAVGHPCLEADHGVCGGPPRSSHRRAPPLSLGQQEVVRVADVVGTLVRGPWAVDGALAEGRGGRGEEGRGAHGGLRRHRGQRVGGGHRVGFHLPKGQEAPFLAVPGKPSTPVRRKETGGWG